MKVNKILGVTAISVMVLSGCGTPEDAPGKTTDEKVSASETQPKTVQLPKSPLDSLEEPYKEIAQHFADWEPPTEGRLTREEAPEDYKGLLDGMVVFENGYMMDEKGRFFGRIYRDDVKPLPTDDQKTGLVLSNIEMLYGDLKNMTQEGGVGVTFKFPRSVLEEIIPYSQNEKLKEVLNEVYLLIEDDDLTEEEKGELIEIMFDLKEAIDVSDKLRENK